MSGRGERVALGAILVLAVACRLLFIDYDLPANPYVDAFKFTAEAERMAATGDLRPADKQHPALLTYALALVYRAGGGDSRYARHLSGRLLTALAGVALTAATWALARALAAGPSALLAALLAAVCPLGVTFSRVVAPDVPLALFVTLALVFALRSGGALRDAVAAGLAAGLAAGTKLTGLFVLPWLALAPFWLTAGRSARYGLRRAVAALLAAVAAFTLSNPFFWPQLGQYRARFLFEMKLQRAGQLGRLHAGWLDFLTSATPTWEQPWLGTSLVHNHGLPLLLLLLAAAVVAVRARERRLLFLLGFALAFLALVSGPGRIKAYRFLAPVLPALFAVAAAAFAHISARLPAGRAVTVALAALVAAVPAGHTAGYLLRAARPTTNDIARAWVYTNVKPGARLFLAPFFTGDLRPPWAEAVSLTNPGGRQYRLAPGDGPSPERQPLYSPALLDEWRKADVRYVVLNSYFDGALSPVPENLRYFPRSVAARAAFDERLRREASLRFEVRGFADGRLGPDIAIYELKQR